VLAIEPDFFRFVPHDPAVRHVLAARKPFLPGYRASLAARSILKVAERIVRFWQYPVPDSAALMINHALQMSVGPGRAPAIHQVQLSICLYPQRDLRPTTGQPL